MSATPAIAEIGLLIYPDCQLAAVYGLTDLFRIANEWALRLAEGAQVARVIRVSHWQDREDGGQVDCVWDSLPGKQHRLSHVIAPPSLVMPERMQQMPAASSWMRDRHAEGSTLCSVCAGAFVLAETGLIDGRRATTHWAFARQLAARFPAVKVADQHMVIDDGDIMTAGGILAWTDLGLTLVERLLGPGVMLATARFLLIDPPRHQQLPFRQFIPSFDHGDDAVRRIQHHIHAHHAQALAVSELADRAGMTERTFLRRFVKATGFKPNAYLQHTRIGKAREALELTSQSVDHIAWAVGYADPAAFRKIFQKLSGLSPTQYRRQFGLHGTHQGA